MNNFTYSGCTTDSGGGGTGHSLKKNMQKLDLCRNDGKYLVGFCSLHTLQLTLANPLRDVIGTGGLGRRNAMQAIHAHYDLQDAMEFGVWEKKWKRAAFKVDPSAEVEKVKRLAAPIITRWWTVGAAAQEIVANLPILIELVNSTIKAHRADSKLNKIASSLKSLMSEPIIVSDIKLIASYHDAFLDHHFSWLQKGDEEIGNTPGFQGRHLLLRYYLMKKKLVELAKDGWKKNSSSMQSFTSSLDGDAMGQLILDPSDPKKRQQISRRAVQEKKANIFMKLALQSLDKHYKIFCKELLFLALYGEKCASEAVAKLLFSPDAEPTARPPAFSEVHQCNIDFEDFYKFLKSNVDVDYQKRNKHIQEVDHDTLQKLAGELIDFIFLKFCFGTRISPPGINTFRWKGGQSIAKPLAKIQMQLCCFPYYHTFCGTQRQNKQLLHKQGPL